MSAPKFKRQLLRLSDVAKQLGNIERINPRVLHPISSNYFKELWENAELPGPKHFECKHKNEPINFELKRENHLGFKVHAPHGIYLKAANSMDKAWVEKFNKHERQYQRKQRWKKIKQGFGKIVAKVLFNGVPCFLGATRLVIIRKNTVIKFPRFYSFEVFLRGWLCNICERNNWNIIDKYFQNKLHDDSPAKVCFAPVLHSYFLGFFIVMQRAEKLTEKEINVRLTEMEANGDWKVICDFCSDPNMNNFGMLNGRMVIIDYAQ